MIWPWLAAAAGLFALTVAAATNDVAIGITGGCSFAVGYMGIRRKP